MIQTQSETKIIYSTAQLNEIFGALSKAQANFKAVEKTQKGHYGEYSDLSDINNATRQALTLNGLSITQSVSKSMVITVLGHSSGEHIVYETHFKQDEAMKALAVGALWTLMRRYALMAALNVSGSDDAEEQNMVIFTPEFDLDSDFKVENLVQNAKNMLELAKKITDKNKFIDWFGKQAIPIQKIKRECEDSHTYLMAELNKIKTKLGEIK